MSKTIADVVPYLQLTTVQIYYHRTRDGGGQRLTMDNVTIELLDGQSTIRSEVPDSIIFHLTLLDSCGPYEELRVRWGRIAGDSNKTGSYLSMKELAEVARHLSQTLSAQFFVHELNRRVWAFDISERRGDSLNTERHSVPLAPWERVLHSSVDLKLNLWRRSQMLPTADTYTVARVEPDALVERLF